MYEHKILKLIETLLNGQKLSPKRLQERMEEKTFPHDGATDESDRFDGLDPVFTHGDHNYSSEVFEVEHSGRIKEVPLSDMEKVLRSDTLQYLIQSYKEQFFSYLQKDIDVIVECRITQWFTQPQLAENQSVRFQNPAPPSFGLKDFCCGIRIRIIDKRLTQQISQAA